jgi:hypothetical protein
MKAISTKGLILRMALAFAVVVVVLQAYPAHAGEFSYPGQNLGKIFQQGDIAAQQNKHLMPNPIAPIGRVRYHEQHQNLSQQPNADLIEQNKPKE